MNETQPTYPYSFFLLIWSFFHSFTIQRLGKAYEIHSFSFLFFHCNLIHLLSLLSCTSPLLSRLNVCSSFRPVGDSPCIQDSSHRGSTRTLVLPWSEKAVSLSASPMYVYDNYKWALRWDTDISVKWTCPLSSFQKKGEELPQGSN